MLTSDHGHFNSYHHTNLEQTKTSFGIIAANFNSKIFKFSKNDNVETINQVDISAIISAVLGFKDFNCSWGKVPQNRIFNSESEVANCLVGSNLAHLNRTAINLQLWSYSKGIL